MPTVTSGGASNAWEHPQPEPEPQGPAAAPAVDVVEPEQAPEQPEPAAADQAPVPQSEPGPELELHQAPDWVDVSGSVGPEGRHLVRAAPLPPAPAPALEETGPTP